MVKDRTSLGKVVVTADGDGIVSHAGSALLVGLADKVGLTAALSDAMAPTRQRVSAHDPGVVLRDLAVMLADGASSLSGLGALRDQEALFGQVASDSTAYRVIDSVDQAGLERLREAVAVARGRAWALGGAPKQVVLDFDATLLEAYSRKQGAAGTFKKGFGHHPLLCYLDGSREALAGVLRDGNAGSNTAFDHMKVGDLALAQLPAAALDGEIVARVDGAGATHEFTQWCRDARIRFSVGSAVTQDVLTEALIIDDRAWKQALRQDGSEDLNPMTSCTTSGRASALVALHGASRAPSPLVPFGDVRPLGWLRPVAPAVNARMQIPKVHGAAFGAMPGRPPGGDRLRRDTRGLQVLERRQRQRAHAETHIRNDKQSQGADLRAKPRGQPVAQAAGGRGRQAVVRRD